MSELPKINSEGLRAAKREGARRVSSVVNVRLERAVTVPEILEQAAQTFRERNAVYKDNHARLGKMLAELFPSGVSLSTAEDHEKFALVVLKLIKLTRYAVAWEDGGHRDSIRDDIVYSAMLEERTPK